MSNQVTHTPGEWRLEPGDPGDSSVGLGPSAPTIVADVPGVEGAEVEICILREPIYPVEVAPNDEYDAGLRVSGTIEGNAELITSAPKLLAFKAYVHARLDAAGVPADPESPHRAEGCRIGGRLDELIGERDRLRAEREKEAVAAWYRDHDATAELLALRERNAALVAALASLVDKDLSYFGGCVATGMITMRQVTEARKVLSEAKGGAA